MEPAGLEYSKIEEAAAHINKRIPFQPKAGIILGTGQSEWLKHISPVWEMSYREIPHLLSPAVITHEGKLYGAYLERIPVLIFSGRVHYYEGYSPQELVRPVRLLYLLGASHLILTNASGGIHEQLHIGQLVLIRDHINLPQISPLRGMHEPRWGTRFPDMTHAYDPVWITHIQQQQSIVNATLRTCTYAYTAGSQLETPAECAFLRQTGADIAGMSTVPEVIAARQCGLTVLGISIVCNLLSPASKDEQVTETSAVDVLKGQNEALWQVLCQAITFVL